MIKKLSIRSFEMGFSTRFLALVLALFVVAASCERTERKTPKHVKVLILGAGISGLKAAETLHKNGIRSFLVLEGKEHIGGRMHHVSFDGNLVPLGAELIDTITPNNEALKSQNVNLKVVKDNYTSVIIRNGETGEMESAGQDVLLKLDNFVKKADQIIAKRKNSGKSDVPLESILSMAGWKTRTELQSAAEFFRFDSKNGIPPCMTSSNAHQESDKTAKNVVVTDAMGYGSMLDNLVSRFRNKVKLNTVISQIKHSNKLVKVKTLSGEEYTAEHVLVTFSSGVLTSNLIKFKPQLPEWKMDSLNLVPMAQHCKVFFKFPVKFWDDAHHILFANKARGSFVHWESFDRKTIDGEPVLLLTMMQDHCLRLEKMTDQEVGMEAIYALRKVYGSSIPWPTALMRSDWNRDPMTMGAYSNRVVGFEEDDLKRLQSPVGRIWFAGEYAEQNQKNIRGAFESGQKMAKSMIKCIRKRECPMYEEKRQEKRC